MMIQKFMPNSPTGCSMHYEVFKNKHSSEEDFRTIAVALMVEAEGTSEIGAEDGDVNTPEVVA